MATDLIKAADDARRLLRGFKAFAEVAEALDATGQLELRAAEATRTLAALSGQLVTAQADIAAAKAEASAARAAVKVDTAKVLARANAEAGEIQDAARAAVRALEVAAQAEVVKAKDAARLAKVAEIDAVGKRNALLAECEALEARLAETKAAVAKLLG